MLVCLHILYMSFAEGFYSFTIQLSDVSRGIYDRLRFKIPRHPNEPMEYLYARVIAYIHSYENDLKFSPGYFEPKLPSLFSKNVIDQTTAWIDIGCPSKEKLTRALKSHLEAKFKVYFYSTNQIDEFCHHLRGSKSNWVQKVSFFNINEIFLEKLCQIKKSSSEWLVTLVDNGFYLVFDGLELETDIIPIEIWSRFQESISNIGPK